MVVKVVSKWGGGMVEAPSVEHVGIDVQGEGEG